MTTTDINKMMKDMMGAFPVDTRAMQDLFRTQAEMGERMSKVMLEAAEKSSDVSSKWTKQTLAKIGEVSTVKDEPADYTKAMSEFASTSAEMAAEHMAAFAEVAKKVQMDTVDLMLTAGKDLAADAQKAAEKATRETQAAVKKAAAAASSASTVTKG